MDILFNLLRWALQIALFGLFFWLIYDAAIYFPGSSVIAATFAGALGGFVCMGVTYFLLGTIACIVNAVWRLKLKPYLQNRFYDTSAYRWLDTRN